MKWRITATMAAALAMAGLGLGVSGCSDEVSREQKTVTEGPSGTTTETHTDSVKTSGDHSPPPTGAESTPPAPSTGP